MFHHRSVSHLLKSWTPVIALAIVIGPGLQSRALAGLVSNGSFETFTGGFSGTPSQLNDTGTGGYTKLTDWTVGPGNTGTFALLFAPGAGDTTGSRSIRFNDTLNLWGPGANGGGVANGLTATSPDGGNYVALDADANFNGTGISQSISGLTNGDTYRVGFWWAAAQQEGFNGATFESLQVDFGAQTQTTTTINLPEHSFSGWMQKSFDFVAGSETQLLSFLAVGGPGSLPPFVLLDGVSVDVVPEPATLLLIGLGAFCLRKRARSAV